MTAVFAGRFRAVVTADAITRDIGVIEIRRYPGHRRVAIVAIVTAGNVGRVFAGRNGAIVTGPAGTDHLRVIHPIGG